MTDVLSEFANIGTLQDDLDIKELQNRAGNEVTMGNGIPKQNEGKVGDITVREISAIGLRAYIKTNSGWIDINTMQGRDQTKWIDMRLEGTWATDATYGTPQYFKDGDGFVHLRGGADSGSLTTAITTLPERFRPTFEQRRLVNRLTDVGTLYIQIINIATTGEINRPAGFKMINSSENVDLDTTTEMCLDGISFFTGQVAITTGGGSGGGGFPPGLP